MTITSVTAPAVTDEGVKRLRAFCLPKKLHSNSTLFDAGYEQAKRDFLERLEQEVGKTSTRAPGEFGEVITANDSVTRAEAKARAAEARRQARATPWWGRLL